MLRKLSFIFFFLFFLTLLKPSSTFANTETELVSVDNSGNPGNGQSFGSSVSTDGRYVAFTSSASNLPGPDDSQQYVYVRDRQSGNTEVINIYPAYYQFAVFSGNSNPIISADGIYVIFDYVTFHTCFNLPRCHDIYVYNRQTGNFSRVNTLNLGTPATNMSISGDGRYIVYDSTLPQAPNSTFSQGNIFLFDQQTQSTTLVSVDNSGNQGDGISSHPSISADGRYVAFESTSTNLVSQDTNNKKDIFIRDLQEGTTKLISVDSSGNQGNEDSFLGIGSFSNSSHSITADGRRIVFSSFATNFAPGLIYPVIQVFVHDVQSGITELASLNNEGSPGNNSSLDAAMSSDGRYIAFRSVATNFYNSNIQGGYQIYIRDLQTGSIFPVTVDNSGSFVYSGNNITLDIGGDGNNIAFNSNATNILPSVSGYHTYLRHFDFDNFNPPIISSVITDNSLITLGNSTSMIATFTDQDISDTHTAIWNWGDGTTSSGTITENSGLGTITGSHTYSNVGVYAIKITVKDTFGFVGRSEYQYVSVYDPTPQSRFSGVRTFISPLGAYIQNPNLTGQIQFGITARYSGSQAVGNVSMNFKDADFKFDSTSVSLLVTANGKATLRGSGTVNGTGNYTFLVTGLDGGQGNDDFVRFQIKDPSNNNVVIYDSQPGAVDTADPTTSVTGQIIVH